MKNNIYVITAYRFGNRENHSYVVNIAKNKQDALDIADEHEDYRGRNKYICEVLEFDKFGNRKTIKSIDIVDYMR